MLSVRFRCCPQTPQYGQAGQKKLCSKVRIEEDLKKEEEEAEKLKKIESESRHEKIILSDSAGRNPTCESESELHRWRM